MLKNYKMRLINTEKLFAFHSIFLGVPPEIENKRCISVSRKDDLDIFEYCDNSEPQDLKSVNKVFFAQL